jgi:hypothetical protein
MRQRLELALFAALALYALIPLAAMLRFAVASDAVFAGSDGAFPADQFQYMTWIREYSEGLLASNTLDIAPSHDVFLHPMFVLSGLVVRLGVGIELAFLVWKPVALVALFLGFRAYVWRFVPGRWERFAALGVALFFSAPTVFGGDLLSAGGETMPALLLWGYLPAALSVALMPVLLLGLEQRRRLLLVAACGALVSWLHPWQGQVLLVTAVAALLFEPRRLRSASVLVPLAAVAAPIAYYFVLSRADSSWELAQRANEAVGDLPLWSVLVALLPLAVPAVWGARRVLGGGGGFAERMLVIWPVATVLVFAFASPSFPSHVLEGVSLPLAVLAVTGLASVRRRAAVVGVFAALMTLPGAVYMLDWLRDTVGAGGSVRYLSGGEDRALSALRSTPGGGGVLSRASFGALVPAATGRQSWVGHPSWTRSYSERARQVEALFSGTLPPAETAQLVRSSGAAFVFVDCSLVATALPALREVSLETQGYGCAAVVRVRRP